MTFQERLELFPPVLCRLLARDGARPRTREEIAMRGALNFGRHRIHLTTTIVDSLSQRTDWTMIGVETVLSFTQGCGVDLTDGRAMVIHDDYLKKVPAFQYLRKSKDWDSYYHMLLVMWRKSYPAEVPANLWPPIRNLLERLTPIIK